MVICMVPLPPFYNAGFLPVLIVEFLVPPGLPHPLRLASACPLRYIHQYQLGLFLPFKLSSNAPAESPEPRDY